MNALQELQSRYAELIKLNSKLPKNKRRYSDAFNKDVSRYLQQNGDKEGLAQWLCIDRKSLNNWTRQIPLHSESLDKASVFLKLQSMTTSDSEITITYPNGVVLKLPMKI